MVETIGPEVLAALVLTIGLAWVLVVLGVDAGQLEARRPRRRCAACGRLLEEGDRRCRCRR
ncbi:MAG TPA: hypothetical protein VFR63_04880 [Gaiellaceae bacterium]|nr:hypothetical protein [Gaiellaceae bacterium]